ncbi:MAG: 2-oxo acid dehydrogenase subunit E2 [Deltaproteobacteria bacterium]|nr:2-oxo acid dehydrogenase subunit E2 [Deltaproteobacteria bacterium]
MEFKLPDIGEGVHEGEIVRWLVKEGDNLAVDQPMVEIMTDKATVEIPSPISGKIQKLHAKEGDVVKVGQVILSLEGGAATATASAPAAKPAAAPAPSRPAPAAAPARPAPTPARAAAPAPRAAAPAPAPTRAAAAPAASHAHEVGGSQTYVASPGRVLATPATRRLARDLGVDLTQVPATGPNGRVTKEDLQHFGGASAAGPAMPVARPSTPAVARPARPSAPTERETLVPFRGIRRKIAEAMTRSKTLIPEFVYVDKCDVTELVAFRKEAKDVAEKQGVKLTYLPFIVKAMIKGLKEFPSMNAELDEQGGNVVYKNYYNIGIAVDTENGLVVPNVKDADRKSILEIAHEITVLAEKARAGKLSLDEMQHGTITITNPGPIGGLLTAPIINWPEVAIMGVHRIVREPIVKNDQIVIGDTMYLSLSVDHRVVDGATAARFCNVVMDYLAHPKKLMLDMA